jgi:hypothetical protein
MAFIFITARRESDFALDVIQRNGWGDVVAEPQTSTAASDGSLPLLFRREGGNEFLEARVVAQ